MIGEKTEQVVTFWNEQRASQGIETGKFQASTFADPKFATSHDELLGLVDAGKKRATAHLLLDFWNNGIEKREVGDYWVILSTHLEPRFLIRITDIDVRPFDEVELSFAEREGEGDFSLEYWAKVHREYFQLQCAEWGVDWNERYDTVCEGFDLIAVA